VEGFIKFGRTSLFAILLVTFGGRLVYDLRAGAQGAALKNAFAYATFMTLVFGLVLSLIWVALNAVKAAKSRRAHARA